MIVTKYDLEKICNYSENSRPSLPQGIIYYLEHVYSDTTDEYKNIIKGKRRDLTIDAILDDKVDEWNNQRDSNDWGIDQEGYMMSVTPQMKSIAVRSQKIVDNQSFYCDIVKKLELLTNQPMTNPQNINVTIKNDPNLTSYDNDQSNFRRIVSKIMMLNSMIGMDSRIGPANSMLVGLDVYMYLLKSNTFTIQNNGTTVTGNISGIDIIPSHLINPKKVILMRNATKSEIGLNVINNINDSTYFMVETPGSWEKCIKWFEII
jgi:hypothetical protein